MAETSYLNAKDVNEAVDLLSSYHHKAKIIAGGTDLMVSFNRGGQLPEALIYIGDINLNYINQDEENLVIGSTTTLSDLLKSGIIKEHAGILGEAIKNMASVAVRNSGTIGGNICNASPAADTAVPLLALGASLILISKSGERVIDCEKFFVGPGETVLTSDEILKEIIIPKKVNIKWAYKKLGRRLADTLSVASSGVTMQIENGKCKDVRIVLGAVAPIPLVSNNAAKILEDKVLDTLAIEASASAASEETKPIDDARSTAWYRKRVSKALVKSLLNQIAGEGDE
ncbi:MAG: hypothetical protein APF76_16770 [Desulfitibacter sp. BRH_c19]|nr:MAG: hypothetical protein APF76_16770 [Desulfitibacter sp. BRH_c19]